MSNVQNVQEWSICGQIGGFWLEGLTEAKIYLEFIECQDDNLDLILLEMQNCRRL